MSGPTSSSQSSKASSPSTPETVTAHPGDAADSRLDRRLEMLGLPVLRDDKPRAGVSACLLGRQVRYNGEAKRHGTAADVLPRWGNEGKNAAWYRDMRARIMTLPLTDIRTRLLQQLGK